MQCPKCQHENPTNAKFCMECGAKLENVCPECGAKLPSEAKFCMECGAKTGEVLTSSPPKLEDMQEQLQDRIPQSLADKLFAGSKEMQGEYRLVTAVFADVVGSSTMARDMPLDQYVDIINNCFKMMVDIISIKYEGSINRFIGDCVLAFFGAPIAHENDAERAILAALDIRDNVRKLGLDISVGINTGMTYVGEMGNDLIYSERSAWGPDVDFAKRLQDAAKPGDIYVGASTHRLTRRAFDFKEPARIEVKGMAEQQIAYPILSVKEHPEKLRGIMGLRALMIGREREIAALVDCANALINEKNGQIVTIVGEAGIGKSRLVKELREHLEYSDTQWLEGRCISIGQSVSFWPFIDMMREYLGISGEDSEKEVVSKLVNQMNALLGDAAKRIIPYVGRMLSVKLPDEYEEQVRNIAPEQLRHQTLLRMRDVFIALSRIKPLVIILEDLHWADDLSLDLLWVLMDELVAAPVMLVCVHRPEREHGSWQIDGVASSKHLERYTRLILKPLTILQSQQMVESLLDVENLPAETEAAILEKSEGNPFFVEEVVRWLMEHDVIYQVDGRWKAKAEIRELAVPDTVQSVILARIDRLHEEVKYVLQCASVIGRVFQHRLLNYLARQGESLEVHLTQLESGELVYKEKILPELEYAFKHALTQETTYQGLLNRQRSVFHERVGEGIEIFYQEQIEEYYEQLAYHYSKGSNRAKAFEYLIKAGQKASERYATQEALSYFQQALDLTQTDEQVRQVLNPRAKLYLSLFRGNEAACDYERLLEITKNSGDQHGELKSLLGLASAYYATSLDQPDFAPKSLSLYKKAYTLARSLGNKAGMARALASKSGFWTDFQLVEREEALADTEKALSLSQEIGNEDLIIDIKIALFNLIRIEERGEELLKLLEPRNDLVRLKEVYFLLMWRYTHAGNFRRCMECCDTAIGLAGEIGSPPVMYPTIKAFSALNLGQYDVAWESLQQEIADESHLLGKAFRNFGIGMYFQELMAYDRAEQKLEEALAQADSLKRYWLRIIVTSQTAKCIMRAGQSKSLDAECLDRVRQMIDHTPNTFGILPAEDFAEVDLYAGNLDKALQHLDKAISDIKKWIDWEGNFYPISVLEVRLRILLEQSNPKLVITLANEGIAAAMKNGYLPLLWRIHVSKAKAHEMLEESDVAFQEYRAATDIITKLADNIPHDDLKHGFLSNPFISFIVSAGQANT